MQNACVAKKEGPTNTVTARTYARRREVLLKLIHLMANAEGQHHCRATVGEDLLEKAPTWRDCTDLGLAINRVGEALHVMGLDRAEVERLTRVLP